MESCQTLFTEELVIDLLYVWCAHMVYVGWEQGFTGMMMCRPGLRLPLEA
jgi:hypothetical protein